MNGEEQEERKQSFVESILSTIGPAEAEAGVRSRIGKRFVKMGKGAASEVVSSTSETLRGTKLFDKTVKAVKKGKGDWRYILFTDGTERAISKDVLHGLMQELGTKTYMKKLALKEGESRIAQAVKSLKYHIERQNPFVTKPAKQQWLKVRQEQAKTLGLSPESYTWVASHKVFLPTDYAKILEEAGIVKLSKKK